MTRRHWAMDSDSVVEALRNLQADYDIGSDSRYTPRLRGVSSQGSGGDYHIRNEAAYMRGVERARHFDRNNMVVGQAVSRLIDNVLQDGFQPDPDTGDEGADKALLADWSAWAGSKDEVDLAQEHNLTQYAWLTLRSVVRDGDIVVLPLDIGRLEAIETHRIRTPKGTKKNVVLGVLLNEQRQHLEYWATRDDIDPLSSVQYVRDVKQYPTRDPATGHRQLLHIYHPTRFSQTRGVTAFAPICRPVGYHDDIQFAKLVQQQIASCFAFIETWDANATGGMLLDVDMMAKLGQAQTETLADGTTRTVQGFTPGMRMIAPPGKRIEGFSPNIPNPEFFKQAELILTIIAVNLGLPLAVLLLDPSKTNFSGWRGAIDQARMGFRRLQALMRDEFYRPLWEWRVRRMLKRDRALRKAAMKSDIFITRHKWNLPTFPYIEPLKDHTTDLLRLRNGLISPRRLHAERGRDFNEIYRETIEDNAAQIIAAKQKAQEINAQFGDDEPVHWREVLNLPAPEGLKVVVGTGGAGAAQPTNDESEGENDA